MTANQITLEKVSLIPPKRLKELLDDIGEGANGFSGNPVGMGKMTLEEYLQQCCDYAEGINLKPEHVPQTIFWILDSDGIPVGMEKIRPFLNDKLLLHGGNIGYYIHSCHRGKGYGKKGLALALDELRKLGESKKALLTVNPENAASIRIIESNGGKCENIYIDPDTGEKTKRYWIRLKT